MTKGNEINNPDSCFNKAAMDEPIFVLRAQDVLAAEIVRQWAQMAIMSGTRTAKIDEALALADAMEAWPMRKIPD